jgi:nitrous oxide reductase accessory protein NosL
MMVLVVVVEFIAILLAMPATAGLTPRKPTARDKCSVCGMFVAKYTNFVGQIQLKNGSVLFFDGPKDLFKYYQAMDRNKQGGRSGDVAALFVTSYYTLAAIDGFSAYYVTGSDVNGPMGRELIPFATEGEAREFMKDHKGKALYRFGGITPVLIKGLD